ncbi:MAG: helix-turn-helix domain-containing protein [Azonexus sp.]|jgi:predicted transcriptional regulator|nr:helix-turn-helix domain-containing protein [Azonexus sp.]
MDLANYIETAADAAGSLTTLASIIGTSQPALSRMKKGREHMPLTVAIKLADTLETDRFSVIVASEIASARDEDEYLWWTGIKEELESEYINETIRLRDIQAMEKLSYIR